MSLWLFLQLYTAGLPARVASVTTAPPPGAATAPPPRATAAPLVATAAPAAAAIAAAAAV